MNGGVLRFVLFRIVFFFCTTDFYDGNNDDNKTVLQKLELNMYLLGI